jgi:hypothetical protein
LVAGGHWGGRRVSAVGEQPPLHGHAQRLVRALPVQRLARAGAVVGRAAHGAAPELVPPRLAPAAPHVGAGPEELLAAVLLGGGGGRPPVHHEPVRRVRLRLGEAPPEVREEGAPGGRPASALVHAYDMDQSIGPLDQLYRCYY